MIARLPGPRDDRLPSTRFPHDPFMVDSSPYLLELSDLQPPLEWASLFGNDHPVELEIGSGKGLFLANAGSANPGHNFLGVELARKYAHRAAERVAKQRLGNVRVVRGDARQFLAQLVPSGSVAALHIYFPDPWWKTRHKKRRVFCAPFVANVERVLVPGGDFWIATDVEEYFGVMQGLVAGHLRFTAMPLSAAKEPAHDLDYLTSFERKYRLEGRPIYRAHYRLER